MPHDTHSLMVDLMGSPQQRPLFIQSIEELPSIFDIDVPPIKFLVEGLIARSAVTLVSGESGAGKTTVVSAIAGAVNEGSDFAGLKTEQSPVLYLDRENPASVVRERLERLGVRDGSSFKIWGGWNEAEPPSLNSSVLLDYVRNCHTKPLIIVDSLIAFHPGNENDNTETRKFLDQARRLTNLGAAVILLHHTGKGENSKQYRGSSDIKGSVDICYTLTNGNTKTLEQITLENFKSRFTVLPELSLRYQDGRFYPSLIGSVGPSNRFHDGLMDILANNPEILSGEFEQFARKQGIPRQDARDFLQKGVNRGCINQGTRGGRGITFSLAESEDYAGSLFDDDEVSD